MNMLPFFRLVLVLLPVAALALPVIDDSPTRVECRMDVGLRRLGTIKPKAVGEMSASRWTLDCGGMDREHADWRAVCDYVAPLGIARIRQQAGWARCEKDPGKYDFAWLDQVVFDAKKRGIGVWMELSYGNPAYKGGGGRQLADGFPASPEGLAAWDRWVDAMARRYRGIVRDWCIWNEPDLTITTVNDPGFAAHFAIRTAEIIKREIPDAKIAAFALSSCRLEFIEPLVKELKRQNKVSLFDSIAYHHYSTNPDEAYECIEECRAFLSKNAPTLKLMEGEGGTQSEWCGAGALAQHPWSERTQAKYDLRRSLGDLGHGDDTEVFHLCDLEYRTSGFHDGLVRYGLVKTAGQADGFRVLKVKEAYYAIQNAVSVFNDSLSLAGRTTSTVGGLKRGAVYDWQDVKTHTPVVVFWDASACPAQSDVLVDAELTVQASPFVAPVWCDVLTGGVYEIPPDRIREAAGKTTYRVPAYDSPTFVTDRALLEFVPSWEDLVKGNK